MPPWPSNLTIEYGPNSWPGTSRCPSPAGHDEDTVPDESTVASLLKADIAVASLDDITVSSLLNDDDPSFFDRTVRSSAFERRV